MLLKEGSGCLLTYFTCLLTWMISLLLPQHSMYGFRMAKKKTLKYFKKSDCSIAVYQNINFMQNKVCTAEFHII